LLYAAHAAPQRRDPRWRLHLLGDQGICAGARAHPGLRAGGRGGWRALHAGALRSEIRRDGMAAEAAVPGLALSRAQGRAAPAAADDLPTAMLQELRSLGLI